MGLEEKLLETAPHWIKGTESTDPEEMGWGYAYLAILGYAIRSVHGFEGWSHEAARARFVATAPADALPFAAADVDVPRFTVADTEGTFRARVADSWGWHAETGQLAQLHDVLERFGFDTAKVWVLDSSTGSYDFNRTWYSAWAVATRDPISWDEGAESPLQQPKREDLYAWFWRTKWAHSVPVYLNIVTGPGYTHDLLQADGLTHEDLLLAGLTHEDIADCESEILRLAYTHQDLAAEGLTHEDIAASGATHRRGLTGR